jgi:steroid 5-alpha reductase family enzyme
MLLTAAGVGLGVALVMLAAWGFQAWRGNAGWVDVFWTFGTGLTGAAAALATGPVPWRRGMAAALLLLWSVRLGLHIARRVAQGEEDARYARMRAEFGPRFQRHLLGFVLIQGPFSAVLALAVLAAARQPAAGFRLMDALALALALSAMAAEAQADRQMRQFRADPANKGKICETGLWALSRHPNYFFEFLFWCAWPLLGLTAEDGWSLLALLAPLFMYLTLRYASGVPPLEAAMLASRGEAYRRYQARTGAILPRFGRRSG